MKINYQQAMEILIKLNGVHHEILSEKKYNQIPRNLLYVLWTLSKRDGQSASATELIDDFLQKHPGTKKQALEVKFSKILKVAVERGFLEKSIAENDNRIKYFLLTIKGKKLLSEIKIKAERLWDIANDK